MLWWWGYTEPVSPRPPRLHRISTTRVGLSMPRNFRSFLQSRGPAGAQGVSEGTSLLNAFNHTAFHYGSRLMM